MALVPLLLALSTAPVLCLPSQDERHRSSLRCSTLSARHNYAGRFRPAAGEGFMPRHPRAQAPTGKSAFFTAAKPAFDALVLALSSEPELQQTW